MRIRAVELFDAGHVMQLGTIREGYPRVTSVYYVTSDDCNRIYWFSEPRRRHSKDIALNPHVAGAIVINADKPVVGLQFYGTATYVTDLDVMNDVVTKYTVKYNLASNFLDRFRKGTNKHYIFEMTLDTLEMFDEITFPGGNVVSVPLA